MLTKEQESFLRENKDIFEVLLPLQHERNIVKQKKKVAIDEYGRVIPEPEIDIAAAKKKFTNILERMDQREIEKWLSLFKEYKPAVI